MKLCIPTTEPNGLKSKVSEHFGRAPYHIVVDLETRSASDLVKPKECSHEDHGRCLPVDLLIGANVDVVACKGIGRGAVARLMQNGIAVFSTIADTVDGVVKEFHSQRMKEISEENICQGHDH